MIQLRFVAEVVSATRDSEGRIVAGHPVQVVELAEWWTFERDLASADPNWTLVGTQADEGEDNDNSHTPARGLSKHEAKVDVWLKDIAPSGPLRKWFGHDPWRWSAFRSRYAAELDGNQGMEQLCEAHRTGTRYAAVCGA